MERGTIKRKAARKQLFSLILALAMALTSVAVPSTTAEAAKTVKVNKVQITSPKKKTVTLVKGKTLQIKVKITPKNAKNKKVTYKSSKKKIASVTSKGKVKGLKKGTAKITVTAKDGSKKKATLTVKVVNPVKVTTVKLNTASVSIDAGKTYTLKATISPKNATNKAVTWTTSNKAVATVTAQGVVKGVKAGTADITATAKDGSKKKATCKVTVKAASTTTPPDDPNPPTPPAEKTLSSIEITTPPTKTEYIAGEKLDLAGMVVTAKYSDDSTKVLEASDYTASPAAGTILSAADKTVKITYKEGVTRTENIPITVKGVTSIRIKTPPTKDIYEEGETFDPAGMVVEAVLAGGDEDEEEVTKEITDYTYSPTDELAVTAGSRYTPVKISYKTGASTTEETETNITVTAKNPLKSISVKLLRTELPREGGCFQDDDVTVTATFNEGDPKEISVADCQVDPDVFTADTTSATVTYWYGGESQSAVVDGFTVGAYLQGYTFDNADRVGTLVRRANENEDAVPTEENAADINLTDDDFVDGIKGKALKMDGTYGLRLDDIAGTDSEGYSISMWVKPDSLKLNQALVISTSSEFGLITGKKEDETWCAVAGDDNKGNGSVKLWSHDNETEEKNGYVEDHNQGTISIGENAKWSHIVLVVDGTKTTAGTAPAEGSGRSLGTLYVNGKKVYSGNVANEKANGRGSNMKTYVGVTGWVLDGYYAGLIDELVFTNDVMTADDVEKSYIEGVEASGNTYSELTSVSPDNGVEVEVPYGTTLADVKRELLKIEYKAVEMKDGADKEVALPTTSDMWTVEGYTVTKEGEVTATARIEAPKGYMFKVDGKLALSITRTVTVKITDPTVISTVTAAPESITVLYGKSQEDIITALKEQITFTAETTDGTPYNVKSSAGTWKLTAKEDPAEGYDAVFELKNPEVGYKYADGIEVKVTVNLQAPVMITSVEAGQTQIEVVAGTEESVVKSMLAALKLTAAVDGGAEAPKFSNDAKLWTIAEYDKDEVGTYTATAALTAPEGYKFAANAGTVSVSVVVEAKTEEKILKSIAIDPKSAHKTKVIVGHAYDKTGLVVKASYTNGDTEDVSSKVTLNTKEVYDTLGTETITISYSEGDDAKTETTSFVLNVVKVEDGAYAYYTFDDTLAEKYTLADESKETKFGKMVKNGDWGMAESGVSTENIYGKDAISGSSLNVNKTTAVQIPETISKDAKEYTINFWAKKNSGTTEYGTIFAGLKDPYTHQKGLIVYSNTNSTIELQANGGNGAHFDMPLGVWKMITLVNKNGKLSVYLDGVEQKFTKTSEDDQKFEELENAEKEKYSPTEGLEKIILGGGPWNGAQYLVGQIDEVKLYDSSLDSTEVEDLYNAVKPVIESVTIEKTAIEVLKADVGVDNAGIQNKLKELSIQAAVRFGKAPTLANDTDWTLTESDNGYTATKTLAIPEGYVIADNESLREITLTVDVTVKDIKLADIGVKTAPNKVYYKDGEPFDATGIVVLVSYDDGSVKEVGKDAVQVPEDTTAQLPENTTADTVQQPVTISYTEGGITKEATLQITVMNPATDKGKLLATRTAYYTFENSLANLMDNSTATWVQNADGNAAGASKVTYAQGKKGNGLQVGKDGAADILKLDKNAESSEFTINMWVKASVAADGFKPVICGTSLAKWNRSLVIYAMPGTATDIRVYRDRADKPETDHQGVLSTEDWVMLTWVNTAGRMKLYKNGDSTPIVDSDTTIAGLPNILLGGHGGAFGDPVFQGIYDEVSVYNVPLTETQIATLYTEASATE